VSTRIRPAGDFELSSVRRHEAVVRAGLQTPVREDLLDPRPAALNRVMVDPALFL